jgi:hypothetical protein
MKKFQLTVSSQVPRIFTAEITIDAETEEVAKAEAQRMFENDEIEWDHDSCIWDEADFEVEEIDFVGAAPP